MPEDRSAQVGLMYDTHAGGLVRFCFGCVMRENRFAHLCMGYIMHDVPKTNWR